MCTVHDPLRLPDSFDVSHRFSMDRHTFLCLSGHDTPRYSSGIVNFRILGLGSTVSLPTLWRGSVLQHHCIRTPLECKGNSGTTLDLLTDDVLCVKYTPARRPYPPCLFCVTVLICLVKCQGLCQDLQDLRDLCPPARAILGRSTRSVNS